MIKKNVGWKGESRRHSLARKGIKTTYNSQGKLASFDDEPMPKECPRCNEKWDFSWDYDADAYYCHNCHNWFNVEKPRLTHEERRKAIASMVARGNWKLPFSEENLEEIFLQIGEKSDDGWGLIQEYIFETFSELDFADPEEITWEGSIDYIYYMNEDQQKDFYDTLNEFWGYEFGEEWDGLREPRQLDKWLGSLDKSKRASGKPFIDFHKVSDTPATLTINNKSFELHNGFRNKRKAEVEISSIERTGEYVAEIVESNDPFHPFKVYKRKVN